MIHRIHVRIGVCVFLGAGGLAGPPARASAQAVVPTPPRQAPLDSVRQRYRDVIYMTRDSLTAVRGSLESFRHDLTRVSVETVRSRAGVVLARCAVAIRLLDANEAVFDPSRAPARPPALKERAGELRAASRTLRSSLDDHCVRGFALSGPGSRADTVRAWGGYRIGLIETALRKYEGAVSRFAQAAGMSLGPAGGRR